MHLGVASEKNQSSSRGEGCDHVTSFYERSSNYVA